MIAGLLVFALAVLQSPTVPACLIAENLTILPFDSGSAALSPRVRAQVEAWLHSYRYPPEQIELLGNTDRVGSRRANQRLSIRRAGAIRDYLVSLGFPRERISVRGTGEDHVIMETADGVPERENRIVWMSFMSDPRGPRC